jgi:hypothetical protein
MLFLLNPTRFGKSFEIGNCSFSKETVLKPRKCFKTSLKKTPRLKFISKENDK